MASVHLLLGWLTAASAAGLVVVSALGIAWPARVRVLLDRTIVVVLGIAAVALLAGAVLPLTGPGPGDPLHFVHALAAPAVVAIGRYLGRASNLRRRAAYMAAAGVLLLGIVYRLFSTG